MAFPIFRLRRGVDTLWASRNPVLSDGEPGLEKNTRRVKYGDGVTPWNDLPYADIPLPDRLSEGALSGTYARRKEALSGVGAVCISMDDAFAAMVTVAGWMEERGQRGTFAITPGLMGGAGKIAAADVQALHAAGHQIAAHSQTHANFTGLTPAQRKAELADPKAYLEGLIGSPVDTFCYPFGTASGGRNTTTDAEVYPLYERILDTSLNSQPALHPKSSPPPALIRRTSWVTNDTHPVCMEMVRQAASAPVVASIFFHDLNTANNPTTAEVLALLDLCADLGVPVITHAEAHGSFRVLGNPSFEDGNLSGVPFGWRHFKSGAGAVSVETVTPADGITGTKAVRLTAGPSYFSYLRQTHPVVAGRTYILSGRARVVSGTVAQANDAFFRLTGRDAGQAGLADAVMSGAPTLGTWAKFSLEWTASQSAASVDVDLVANDIATATAVEFDHVWFGPKYLGDFG